MSSYARQERAARRLAKELARQRKEQAKRDELAQARFEVEEYESRIEQLLSLHKEVGPTWQWRKVACTLAPLPARKSDRNEQWVRQNFAVKLAEEQKGFEAALEAAQKADEEAERISCQAHAKKMGEWETLTDLARRMCVRDSAAYQVAMEELSPLAELAELGSEMQFRVHSPSLVECVLSTNGPAVVPNETKTLTGTGKLSVKNTPRGRYHELYQDYVCGAVLRVMREIFALLPVDHVLVTAVAEVFDSGTGETSEQPVLSVVASREDLAPMRWDLVDPSDAVDRLTHRGDFKASRKSGAFLPIEPLRAEAVVPAAGRHGSLRPLLAQATVLLNEIQDEIEALS